MNLKTAGLWAAAVAVAAGITIGLTHPAVARDREHGRHIGPTRPERTNAPNFTPIAPENAPKFTPIAPANAPKFTPIAPANPRGDGRS